MNYSIYCDESCHLEHDNSDKMVLGFVRGGRPCLQRSHRDSVGARGRTPTTKLIKSYRRLKEVYGH